jgi:hypothetical protein
LPSADLASAAALAAAADRFYTGGRAVGWFDAVRRPLRKTPSALLGEFAAYLAARSGARSAGEAGGPGESRAIEEEQLGFLEGAYGKASLGALYPALRDLVMLHGAWGRALAEGERSVLDLSYDPEEILVGAARNLASFARSAARRRGAWRVLPDDEEGARIESA